MVIRKMKWPPIFVEIVIVYYSFDEEEVIEMKIYRRDKVFGGRRKAVENNKIKHGKKLEC